MVGAFGAVHCVCEPNADWFVQKWFSDCIYTTWELMAFWIGMSSVMFWIVAQLPQFISNVKNQTAEALSPWFLFQWLAGDSFNLLGCLLTGDQLATETFTATYFIFADCAIISQYIYYTMRTKEKLSLEEKDEGASSLANTHVAEFNEPSIEAFSEFQRRLAKLSIGAPDLREDLEFHNEAHHRGHHYHPVTFVAGRSGASMIAHALQSPHSPHMDQSEAAGEDLEFHNEAHHRGHQYHPVTFVAGRSGAAMIAHAMQSPHSPQMDHPDKSPTPISSTPTTVLPSPGRGRLAESNFRGNHNAQCQAGQFRSVEERNFRLEQCRRAAKRLGKIPEVHVEQLFPTTNDMKRHMRRLINQYGLESGPPSASRLTIHHAKSLGKRHVEQQIGGPSRLGSQLTKRPVRAAACLASLLAVGTSTNYYQKSGISDPSRGLAIGSRRLLMDTRSDPRPGGLLDSTLPGVDIGGRLALICGEGRRPWWLKSFGSCLGWGSSVLYFGSRFSQIAMNYQRRSAEGLSLAMLGCAILANTCMGVSILMRAKSSQDLANKAPWILGSMGTVSLDIFILLQAKYLAARPTKSVQAGPDENTPLLA